MQLELARLLGTVCEVTEGDSVAISDQSMHTCPTEDMGTCTPSAEFPDPYQKCQHRESCFPLCSFPYWQVTLQEESSNLILVHKNPLKYHLTSE